MVNEVMLLGRLGENPQSNVTQSGTMMSRFTLATSEKTKTGGEKTEWHRIVAFGKTAELCDRYLEKGSQAFIAGKLTYGSYTNREGVKVYTTNIIANRVLFLGKKKPQNDYDPTQVTEDHAEQTGESVVSMDGLPF